MTYCTGCNRTEKFVKTGKSVVIDKRTYYEARCNFCGKLLLFSIAGLAKFEKKPRKQKVWR